MIQIFVFLLFMLLMRLPDIGNRSVTVLGLPLTPLPAPPAKLLVGPQLLIIDKNANQLKIKSVRSKCSQG